MKFKVQADKGWQDTGYKPGAQSGPYIIIRASGDWHCRPGSIGARDANGRKPNSTLYIDSSSEGNTNYPLHEEGARIGMLIGKIGEEGDPFAVGDFRRIDHRNIPSDVSLFLRMNDNDDGLSDNSGSLDVEFSIGSGDTSRDHLVVPGYRGRSTGYKMAKGQKEY
ncbi:hypothetical protein [Myxococcus xanthus]|uniref:hypothetical protein n=1 Tax=Myxococcus xanthus TaxID=34 RepID=UPI001129488C|nr:hypothetical protein [Myxococcus xanthus]